MLLRHPPATESAILALMEPRSFTLALLAGGVLAALLASRLPHKPAIVLALTAVPVIGVLLVPVFC